MRMQDREIPATTDGAASSSQTLEPPLTLNGYQNVVVTTDQKRDAGLDLSFPLLGLFGETGSLLSEAKKKQRDAASYLGYAESVIEELGNVMWYLTIIAARSKLRIAEIIKPGSDLPFASLQPQKLSPQLQPSPAFERTLLQLASEVGLLMMDAKTRDLHRYWGITIGSHRGHLSSSTLGS